MSYLFVFIAGAAAWHFLGPKVVAAINAFIAKVKAKL
jgi:hypothetical protein